MYFLDTNICIYFLKGKHPSIRENLLATPPNEIKIPVIVHSELLCGVQKSSQKKENLRKVREFLLPFEIVSYTEQVSGIYAEIRAGCEKKGQPVGPNDLLIAAIVKANNGTLVTRNTKEFSRIYGLQQTKW